MPTVPLVCTDCTFKFSAVSTDTMCPKCGGLELEIEVNEAVLAYLSGDYFLEMA